MDFKRLAGWAGLLVVVLFVLNIVLSGSFPTSDDPTSEIGSYISEDVNMHKAALLVGVIAAIPIALFLAGFLIPFWKSDREYNEGVAILIVLGFIFLAAGVVAGQAILGALILRGGEELDSSTVRALWDAQTVAFTSGFIGLTVLAGGAAMGILRRGVTAAWLGWLSVLVAALGLTGLFGMLSGSGIANISFAAFVAFVVWVAAASVEMLTVRAPASSAGGLTHSG